MAVPLLSKRDMIAISRREERTEAKLEKALAEIIRLRGIIKTLKTKGKED